MAANIKCESVPQSQGKSKLSTATLAFFKHLATVVLPYIVGSVGVCVLWGYFVFGLGIYEGPKLFLMVVVVLGFSFFAFLFGCIMAAISSLKSIAICVEDFAGELFEKIKTKMEAKVSSMNNGLTKQQAEVLLKKTVKDIKADYKKTKAKGGARAGLILILSLTTWITSKILIGRIKNASGLTISVGLLFSNPITALGAVFFNVSLLLSFLQIAGFVFVACILVLPWVFL